jgi:hypothetical protein
MKFVHGSLTELQVLATASTPSHTGSYGILTLFAGRRADVPFDSRAAGKVPLHYAQATASVCHASSAVRKTQA